MPQRWQQHVVVPLLLLAAMAAGCAADGRFNVQNARAHVERLAGALGSRPAGTDANEKARAYLIETLQLYGFDVRVQEADAAWREGGTTVRVANIIATRQGAGRDAVALVAHYDSVPWGPGAGDDALGTAVALEAARVLAARANPRHTLMVLLTDGEERGLMGARALADDPEVRARLRTFLNLEAIGTSGPFVLFETGPGTSPALRAWAGARRPRGGSYMQSIYDALPNDTDFSVFRELPGVTGINFAAAGDGYAYHTDRDRADRVTNRVLAQAGAIVLDVVDGLEARETLIPDPTPAMYTSVLDRTAFVWSLRTGVGVGWTVAVLGAVLWLVMSLRLVRSGGALHLVMTAAWALIAAGAVLGALLAAVWLVRNGRAELHPWYASPWRLFAFMTMMVVAVSWMVRRVAAALPRHLRPDGSPLGVWFAALPVWVGLLVAALLYAPAASYLLFFPLIVLLVLGAPATWWTGANARPVAVTPATTAMPGSASRSGDAVVGGPIPSEPLRFRTWPLRVASVVVLVVVWALWVPDVLTLLPFAVTVLGRLPIVTPTWLYPAVFFAFGIVLWPPVLAVLVGRERGRVAHGAAAAVLMVSIVVTGLLAYAAPAFTNERPQQRSALFVDDRVRSSAHWELYGNEPGVDIGHGAPANVAWRLADQTVAPGTLLARKAFRFRGDVPAVTGPVPATVVATVVRRAGDADLEVSVTPSSSAWNAVAFVLPEAVVPTRTSLAGRTRGTRWQAWHLTVPADGLTWRATVPLGQIDKLSAAEVWIGSERLPGAAADGRLPSWLEAPHTAWMSQHLVMVPASFTEAAADAPPVAAADAPLPVLSPPAVPTPLPTAPVPQLETPR
ncbi:MAG TPA: M20/M25/M40 family metallo-hydrolase [Luteitalea sp.]|nr:M20/M25/M40 family metallo-hydrolase [Luteitalea sp.]